MRAPCTSCDPGRIDLEPAFVFEAELPIARIFFALGFPVEIRTNDPQVLDLAEKSWAQQASRAIPVEAPAARVRIRVREGSGGVFPPAPSYHGEAHLACMTADQENHAICDLNRSFAFIDVTDAVMRDREYMRYHFLEAVVLLLISTRLATAIHAACVSRNGTGLLLSGSSGAGKSTLAFACARAGFTYTTDDACYLLNDADPPTVIGHSHKFRFRPHARELFPELAGRRQTPRAEGKPSIEVLASSFPAIACSEHAHVDIILLLRRSAASEAQLVPVSTTEALRSLQEHLYPAPDINAAQRQSLERLAPLRAYEFHYSTLDEAVACLRKLTGTGR